MRDMTDFSRVFKECAWLLGCAATALVLPRLGLEDKGSQTLFVTISLYLLSGVARVALWGRRRFGTRESRPRP